MVIVAMQPVVLQPMSATAKLKINLKPGTVMDIPQVHVILCHAASLCYTFSCLVV